MGSRLKKVFVRIFSLVCFDARLRGRFIGKVYGLRGSLTVRRNVVFYGSGRISVAGKVLLNEGVFVDLSGHLDFGCDIAIGMRAMLLTSSHRIGKSVRCGPVQRMKTTISDGVWIGAGAIVLPGVTIGSGAVISAGEIVSEDVPPNVILKQGVFSPIVEARLK